MLSQLKRLSVRSDGRYATDEELRFVSEFCGSFALRVQTYQAIQAAESTIVQQVYEKMRSRDPDLFLSGNQDISDKWKRDTIRVLRYSAVAVLLNDPEMLRERLLFWFETIMKAFGAQHSCRVTYEVMQEVVQQHLTANQSSLFCPILEINRRMLGGV